MKNKHKTLIAAAAMQGIMLGFWSAGWLCWVCENVGLSPDFLMLLAAALILAFVYLALPKERGIERRVDATLVQNGSPAERRQTALTISGTYKSSLFGGDSFAGKVEIDCLPVTAGELLNVVFSAEDKGYGALTYRSGESLEFVGYMRMSKTADEVIICLFEDMGDGRKGWSADTGAVISYPDNIENIGDKLY